MPVHGPGEGEFPGGQPPTGSSSGMDDSRSEAGPANPAAARAGWSQSRAQSAQGALLSPRDAEVEGQGNGHEREQERGGRGRGGGGGESTGGAQTAGIAASSAHVPARLQSAR